MTITGTVLTQTAEVGITVNGVLASVVGNQFVANGVAFVEGSNVITAQAVDGNGAVAEARVILRAQTTGPQITLQSNIESGIAPLSATLTIAGTFGFPTSILSYSGPGTAEITPISAEEYRVRFTAEGVYFFTAHVTDTQGATYTDTVAITVMNRAQLDTLLRMKWADMRDALRQGNVEQAVAYFTYGSQDKYRQIFTAISDKLFDEATNLPDITLVTFYGTTGKYRIQRTVTINGQPQTLTYWVYFIQDTDGIWRIKQF